MALTPSNMLPLGTKAPDFNLIDTVSDKRFFLKDLRGKHGTVILFICNHCPYVIYVNSLLVSLALEYQEKGISFVAISSNDVENYPQDAPHLMKKVAEKEGYPFPYLYDETQEVAKDYDAACTPDIYLFDDALKLIYRGQLDDARPGNEKAITGADLRFAMDHLLYNQEISMIQKPSMGCNIKWK